MKYSVKKSPKEERAINRREVQKVSTTMYKQEMEEYEHPAYERIENMRSAFYGGIDPRRRQEVSDGGMIEEDPKSMANMPTEAKHHEYPSAGYYTTPYIDATVDDDNDI
jgi:hypothetical protein